MANKRRAHDEEAWANAQKLCRLTARQVEMGRALGMNAPVGVTVEAPFAASAAGGAMDGLTDDGHRLPGA